MITALLILLLAVILGRMLRYVYLNHLHDEPFVETVPTAYFVRQFQDWTGDARLYRLSQPVEYGSLWDDDKHETKFVVVSAAGYPGPETMAFPHNGDQLEKDPLSWLHIDVIPGVLDHAALLHKMGFGYVR